MWAAEATPWALFTPSKTTRQWSFIGVEAAGEGLETGKHAASLGAGAEGVFHGMLTYVSPRQQRANPEHKQRISRLRLPRRWTRTLLPKNTKRAQYISATDKEAVDAFLTLSKEEGILPALESSHAVAYAMKLAPKMKKTQSIVVTLSGRGDKDVETIADYIGAKI